MTIAATFLCMAVLTAPPETSSSRSRADGAPLAAAVIAYSTYFGGSGTDDAAAVSSDGSGGVYVAGQTSSADLPLLAAMQSAYGGQSDAWLARFGPTGALIFATYFGGGYGDGIRGVATDSTGNAIVVGFTAGGIAVLNAFQPTFARGPGGFDAFIAKLAPDGTLIYSSYLGGTQVDEAYAVAVDAAGNAVVTGYTSSSLDFPLRNALQPVYGGGFSDAFVTTVSPTGALLRSTYLGADGGDAGQAVVVRPDGSAIVLGDTQSVLFPLVRPLRSANPDPTRHDLFLSEIAPTGASLTFSSYLGGLDTDLAGAIGLDGNGIVLIAGRTSSVDFPVKNAWQTSPGGGGDAFVAALDLGVPEISWSSYLGGTWRENAESIGVDPAGNVHVAGQTLSADFPVVDPIQPALSGTSDALYVVFAPGGTPARAATFLGGVGTEDARVAIDACGSTWLAGRTQSADFPVVAPIQPSLSGVSDAFLLRLDEATPLNSVGNTLRAAWEMIGTSIRFTWTDVPALSPYNLDEKLLESAPFTTLAASAPSGNPGVALPAPPAALVFYSVAAVSCGREGPH